MFYRLLLTCMLVLGIASTASAIVGPPKASSLVNVTAFFEFCQATGAKKFDLTTNAVGQNVLFAIPPKKALVANAITARVAGLSAGEIAQVFVDIEFAGGASNGLIVLYTSPANAVGIATATLTLPTGVAFAPGEGGDICVKAFPGNIDVATIYGYFAPNK